MILHMAFFLSQKNHAERAESPSQIHFASAEQRVYACAIDMLLLSVVAVILHIFFAGTFLLLQAIYFIFFWYYQKGKTPGNRFMHIQVTSLDGSSLHLLQAAVRFVGFLLSVCTIIGGAWVLFDTKKQGLHDKLAKTVVIKIS